VKGQALDEVGEENCSPALHFPASVLVPTESVWNYPVVVAFAGNEYYSPAEGQGSLTLGSADWLKDEAVQNKAQGSLWLGFALCRDDEPFLLHIV